MNNVHTGVALLSTQPRGVYLAMALPVFPDQNLASFIQNFTEQLDEDFQSPTVSKFQDYMPRCRAGLQSMEEVGTGWGMQQVAQGEGGR